MAKNKNTNRQNQNIIKGFNKQLLPLAFVLLVVPLIVFLKFFMLEDIGLKDSVLFNVNEWCVTDIFLYNKGFFFVLASVVMVGILVLQAFKNKKNISFPKLFIPLAGYMLLSFISACASVNTDASFGGGYQQYESVWVLLGYGIAAYYAALFVRDAQDVKILTTFLTIGTLIMLFLGVLQLLSKDFFQSDFFISLLKYGLPKEYRNSFDVKFNFESDRVYMTLYNPNYVGSYASLLSPIFLMLALSSKKPARIVLNLGIFAGLLLTLLASGSRAGFIGVIAAIILLIIIFNKRVLKYWSEALIIVVLFVGIIYTMNNYTNNGILNRFKSALSFESTTSALQDIETTDDSLIVTYNNEKVIIKYTYDSETSYYSIGAYTEDGTSIELVPYEDGTDIPKYTINDPRFENIHPYFAFLMDYPGLNLLIDGHDWYFTEFDGSYYHFNDKYNLVKLNNSESFGPLADCGGFASRRGFIWSKTIPLLKDYILTGSGPDTFTEVYPNTDYVDQYNAGFLGETMTKPHNMYLQIAVQTGLISLLCFLAFYFWYFISTVRIVRKTEKTGFTALVSIGILCGTFGYMVVGIINDSTVAVAPLFWSLLGVGIANNFILKKTSVLNTEV